MHPMVFAYITTPSEEKAREIARHLLEKRLIGCANIFPIRSLYWWQGKIADEQEAVLIVKTTEGRFDEMKREVERIHPYSVPCIIRLPVEVNDQYAAWLTDEMQH